MDKKVIVLFARVLLGIILFWQGFGKVFNIGLENLYNGGFKAYEETFLPEFLIKFTAYFTSYGELIFGALLFLGLFRTYAYYGIGLILLIVSFGHGIQAPVWDLQHVFIRSVFLIFVALMLHDDTIALDHYIKKVGRDGRHKS